MSKPNDRDRERNGERSTVSEDRANALLNPPSQLGRSPLLSTTNASGGSPSDDPLFILSPLDTDLIPLREVPRILPRRNGKRVHLTTVWRWTTKGVGGIILPVIHIGRTPFTSRRALIAFCDRREVARKRRSEWTPTGRERARAQASNELEQLLRPKP